MWHSFTSRTFQSKKSTTIPKLPLAKNEHAFMTLILYGNGSWCFQNFTSISSNFKDISALTSLITAKSNFEDVTMVGCKNLYNLPHVFCLFLHSMFISYQIKVAIRNLGLLCFVPCYM